MITDEQFDNFIGDEVGISSATVASFQSVISWTPPVSTQDKIKNQVWDTTRIAAAGKSLDKAMGVNDFLPVSEVERQSRLEFWWRETGQFMPKSVVDELGVTGGERVPTVQESIDLEDKQQVSVVKDFLGIKRPESKDPLADITLDFDFDDPEARLGVEGEKIPEVEPKMVDIIKNASDEDLKAVSGIVASNFLEFDEGIAQAVEDEIKIRDMLPDIIDLVNDKPAFFIGGTQFFNRLNLGTTEFLSEKGLDIREQLFKEHIPGFKPGTSSTVVKTIARLREQLVTEDPRLRTRLKLGIGETAAELLLFVGLPDASKAKAFTSLSRTAKAAIGIGTKAGLLEILKAPEAGETFEERAKTVAVATSIGAVTGVVLERLFTAASAVFEKIKDIPVAKQAEAIIFKNPDLGMSKQEVISVLKHLKSTNPAQFKASIEFKPVKTVPSRVIPQRAAIPTGFRTGFADVSEPGKLAKRVTAAVVKTAAKTKEAATIQAAKAILATKTQPSKDVKPVKVLTKVDVAGLKEIGALGEGENLRIVRTPELKRSIQADEKVIAELKTRRNKLLAEKQFVQAKVKAQEIAKKEIALGIVKEKAGIKLEQTIQGSRDKIKGIRSAQKFKDSLRDDAISMVTSIEGGLRQDFINRANKVKTLKGLNKLVDEVERGVQKFEKKVAIKELDKILVAEDLDSLPSPQREKLIEIRDSISTKKISKKDLEGPPRDPDDLDVKARRGRNQLLGDDLQSLQRVTQRLAGELAGQLQALEPKVEEALRLPNVRVEQLNLLKSMNANEMTTEDINYVIESWKNTVHLAKIKGKLLVGRGFKPLEGTLDKAPSEIRPSRKVAKVVAKGGKKSATRKKSLLEKAGEGTNKVVRLNQMHADTLIERITNADAPSTTLILDTLPHKGLRQAAETFNAWRKVSIDEFDKIGFEDLDQVLGEHTVTLAGVEIEDLTMSELMSLEMDTRSADNLLQRLNAEGIQIGDNEPFIYEKDAHGNDVVDRMKEINDAVAIVRKDKMAMALLDFTERMNPVQVEQIDGVIKLMEGHNLARRENYYPRSRVGDKRVSGPKGKISIPPEKVGRFQEAPGGTKPLRLKPWHEIFLSGLEADASMSMAIPLRNARVMLGDKGFTDAIKANGRELELDNIIQIFSNTQGITTSKDIIDVYGSFIIKARTTSALGFRVSTVGTQVMSFYTAQAITGNQGAVVLDTIIDKELIARIHEDSALMELRHASRRVGIEVGTSASDDAFDLLFFGKTKSLQNKGMKGLIVGDKLAIQNIYKKLVLPELLTKERSGKNVSPFGWEGEGQGVLDVKGFTEADINSDAFRYAAARRLEYVVRRTQPMFDMLDRSVSMADTRLAVRSFHMFMTAFNAMNNVVESSFIQHQKGLISTPRLTQKLGSVGASLAAVAVWKRGLKFVISSGIALGFAAFGIFKFREPKEKKETLKDLAFDTLKSVPSLNPVTRILGTAVEIAAARVAGKDYPWGREPVENPIIEVMNSGGGVGVDIAEVILNARLAVEFVPENNDADREHNDMLAKKMVDDLVSAIKNGWDFGTTIAGAPFQAPVQEFIKPLFAKSKIAIIREITFADVESPQKFSESVFKLFEQRDELNDKKKTKRLNPTEERTLKSLNNFVNKMNSQAKILKETQQHEIRKIRFQALQLHISAVESNLKLIQKTK